MNSNPVLHRAAGFSLSLMQALYVACLIMAAFLAQRFVTLLGISVPGGTLAFSCAFLITDIINECFGRKIAFQTVLIGFLSLTWSYFLAATLLSIPTSYVMDLHTQLPDVLSSAFAITIGGILAYLGSQTLDVIVFHQLCKLTKGRWLWLRNNISTLISQSVDSLLFLFFAFGINYLQFELIFGILTVKFVFALLDTPICYTVVYLLRAGPSYD